MHRYNLPAIFTEATKLQINRIPNSECCWIMEISFSFMKCKILPIAREENFHAKSYFDDCIEYMESFV